MPNPLRRYVNFPVGPLLPAVLFCLAILTSSAFGQSTAIPTALQKQLDRIDFAVSGAGFFTDSVSGTEKRDNTALTVKPSNTVGELVTLRYIKKPILGFEFNFGNARFNQDFRFALPTQNYLPGGAQNGFRELSLGYVAHPPRIFGVQTYVGAGGGTIRFKPTTYGGQGLPQQYRAAYFYDAGIEDTLPTSHFGYRVGFRQLIYLAPDFGQNYLTITRRARTSQPTIGFFVRF